MTIFPLRMADVTVGKQHVYVCRAEEVEARGEGQLGHLLQLHRQGHEEEWDEGKIRQQLKISVIDR